MSAPSSRLRSALRESRPQGRAWWLIAGACVAGTLLFVTMVLGGREAPADASGDAPRPDGRTAPLAALPAPPAATDGVTTGIAYPPPPPPPPVAAAPAPPAAQAPGGATSAAPVAAEGAWRPPRPIATPGPNYPRASLRRGEAGEVVLRIHVGADGRPEAIDVVRSSGHRRLDQSAVAAVRRWRFEPAMENGQAVRGDVQVPVAFTPEAR